MMTRLTLELPPVAARILRLMLQQKPQWDLAEYERIELEALRDLMGADRKICDENDRE